MASNKKIKIESMEGFNLEDEYVSGKQKDQFLQTVLACLQKIDYNSNVSSVHAEDRQVGYTIMVDRAIEMAKVVLAKVK